MFVFVITRVTSQVMCSRVCYVYCIVCLVFVVHFIFIARFIFFALLFFYEFILNFFASYACLYFFHSLCFCNLVLFCGGFLV